jgi:hypothetical protein
MILPCLLGLIPQLAGCITFYDTARTMLVQPAHFADHLDRVKSHCLHVRMAKDTLKGHSALHEGHTGSAEYADGFVDGYANYLDKGGTGDAPALPPRRYWRTHYRTPEGRLAVEDYFAGYRAGAAAAIASGFRVTATVATSLPPRPPPDVSIGAAVYEAGTPTDAEVLPPPRSVEPRRN